MHISLLSLLFSLSLWSVSADVSVQYPLEDQLPLIARTGSPYSWSFADGTFLSSKNETIEYLATNLPSWIVFDASSRSFYGTPSQDDVGSSGIEVSAKDSTGSVTSSFVLQTTSDPPPKVQHPVVEQFHLPNPSLSSVFLVSEESALRGGSSSSSSVLASKSTPALRIPPKWSFSIGFQYDTFTLATESGGDVYYAALQRDGSPLPSWIKFNQQDITLDGVTPASSAMKSPFLHLPLALHASDRKGYSGASLPFDIFVASHEVSLASSSLPTINVTAETPFSVSLNSPIDFSGILLDGEPIRPDEIVTLEVDTSFYGSWLKYDTDSRTLSGQPPEDLDDSKTEDGQTLLPVTITTTVNQTLETNVSLSVVPSYFSADTLQPILVQAGDTMHFNLKPFFSNATGTSGQDDVSLSASFDPQDSTGFLSFDPNAATVSGTVPANFSTSNFSHVTIAFTAYSHITHSTSHTSLPVSLTPADFASSHNNGHSQTGSPLSPTTRKKLLLGLEIAFGIIGGLVFLGALLATMRKCAAVRDTALVGEDAEKAWTAEEKKWYGIGIEVAGETYQGPGTPTSSRSATQSPTSMKGGAPLTRMPTRYNNARARSRSPVSELVLSPGVMRKGDFLGKVKATARKVSGSTVRVVNDTYRRAFNFSGASSSNRKAIPKFTIGKPTLIMSEDGRKANAEELSYHHGARRPRTRTLDPFEDQGYAASGTSGLSILDELSVITGTSVAGSPSSSTGGRSLPSPPRRRPDFAPPLRPSSGVKAAPLTTPPEAHVSKTHVYAVPLTRQGSLDSDGSAGGSDGEVAIVQRAERARSIRSLNGKDGSVWSFHTQQTVQSRDNGKQAIIGKKPNRPRLVPFTSAARVPVPKPPSNQVGEVHVVRSEDKSVTGNAQAHPRTKRVVSQMARVFRSESTERRVSRAEGKDGQNTSGDDLSVGIEYVRALGDNLNDLSPGGSPSPSFSVAESSHLGQGTTMDLSKIPVPRMLARTNEHFRFRVPLSLPSSSTAALEVKLTDGSRLPGFIRVDLNASSSPRSTSSDRDKDKRIVELSGLAGNGDVGQINVGVYERGGTECVGRIVLEVVERS